LPLAQIAASDLLDIILTWVTKLSTKAPKWDGRPMFGEKGAKVQGLTFGTKQKSVAACKGFLVFLGALKLSPTWALLCLLNHRLYSGYVRLNNRLWQ
jgi:hypothetical protein